MVGFRAGSGFVGRPGGQCGGSAHVGELEVVRGHAGVLTDFNGQIVNIDIIGAAARCERTVQRRIDDLAIHIRGDGETHLVPGRGLDVARVNSLQRNESAEVVGVGHITGLDVAVAGGSHILVEAHHQRIVVLGQIETLEADHRGVGRVGVEVEGAVTGMVVRAGDVGIAGIGAAKADLGAVRKRAGARAETVHIHHVGQLGGRSTQRLEALHVPVAKIDAAAGAHIDLVVRVGLQVGSNIEGVTQRNGCLVVQRATIGNNHQFVAVAHLGGIPRDGRTCVGDAGDRQMRRHRTGDRFTHEEADVVAFRAHSTRRQGIHVVSAAVVVKIQALVSSGMHIESGVGTRDIAAGVVQHRHHDIAAAIVFERHVEGDVHPVVGPGIGEVDRAVKHLEHLAGRNPIAAAEAALVGVAHIDHDVLGLRCSVNVLEGDTVDGAVDGAQVRHSVNLFGERIVVERVERQEVTRVRGGTAIHNHRVQTVGARVGSHRDRHGNRTRLAAADVFGRQVVGVVAVGYGIQIGSSPDGAEKHVITVEVVTRKDVVGRLQMTDYQPVVSSKSLRRISSREGFPNRVSTVDRNQVTIIEYRGVIAGSKRIAGRSIATDADPQFLCDINLQRSIQQHRIQRRDRQGRGNRLVDDQGARVEDGVIGHTSALPNHQVVCTDGLVLTRHKGH